MTLDDRIRDVLGRLQMLADGATQKLDPDKSGHQTAESSAPAGVAIRSNDQPPPKHMVSLYEWYSWHFDAAYREDDRPRLESLYLVAEVDYRSFRYRVARRVSLKSGAHVENDPTDPGAAERVNAERIVEWYESVPAHTVAMLEEQTISWVRKARLQNDRNPEDGRPRPEFYDWAESERQARVHRLAETMGPTAAAQHLGVDRKTVKRYWPAVAEGATVAA